MHLIWSMKDSSNAILESVYCFCVSSDLCLYLLIPLMFSVLALGFLWHTDNDAGRA